jgi:hypothetical protein
VGFVKDDVPQRGTKELAYRLNGATLKPFLALTLGLSRCFAYLRNSAATAATSSPD